MRGGDFSAWIPLGDLIYNPFPIDPVTGLSVSPGSRQQFVATPSGPNANPLCTPASPDYVASRGGCPNMIPTSMISQVSLNLIKILPMPTNPNAPPGVPNYSANVTDTYHANTFDGRADYFYSDNLRFFDRYTFTQFYKSAPGIFGPVNWRSGELAWLHGVGSTRGRKAIPSDLTIHYVQPAYGFPVRVVQAAH